MVSWEEGKCSSLTDAKILIILTVLFFSIYVTVKVLLHTVVWQSRHAWMVTDVCALQILFPSVINQEASWEEY